ncbi:MAG TPA: phosphodiesterase [Actinobacteria bacterium]|nr:phosphodiesterase [Actinomycetota bacterium]
MQSAIENSGYYPGLVIDALDTALAGESVEAYVVQHEATFDREELRRHITVLALTPTRLIVGHTDEHPADEGSPTPFATSGTESVRLEKVDSVVVTRVVSDPATYAPHAAVLEVVLTIGWGAVSRIDLEPAACPDPSCEADHGYTGTSSNDDFSLRVSAAADGVDTVEQALSFAQSLSAATARAARH